jgi:hypothetical protein
MKFDEYIQLQEDASNIIEFLSFIDDPLNEKYTENIQSILTKIGLKAHKTKGLLSILKDMGKNLGSLIYHMVKAYDGNEVSKEKVKELSKTIKKEDLMDLFLRLDMLTLHMLTGPLHMFDALTGWHIAPDIQKKSQDIKHRAKRVIDHLEKIKDETTGKTKKKINKYLTQLKNIFQGTLTNEV